jgi:hypothetical protein
LAAHLNPAMASASKNDIATHVPIRKYLFTWNNNIAGADNDIKTPDAR